MKIKKKSTIGVDIFFEDIEINGKVLRVHPLIIEKLWVFSLFMILSQKNHLTQLIIRLKM